MAPSSRLQLTLPGVDLVPPRGPGRPSKATASTAPAHGKRSAGAGAGRAGASSGVGLSLTSPHGNHGERLGMVVDRSFLPGVEQ